MNNIESTKTILQKMQEKLENHKDQLNKSLDNFKIKHIDISKSLTNIQQQIKSVENKFTIAFVGTFKTGKSTIINSLLDLKGESRLSSEYDPDTAKSIRLIYADGDHKNGDAEVDFNGAYPVEKLSWTEAKRYTSQVELNKADESFRKKAATVSEVKYYISNPLLKLCNILDLPGTGTGEHYEHTLITDEKIMEADCFFWVVSTSDEPDVETIRNLKKISHKLLPIINVWQKECDSVSSKLTPEHIITELQENFSAYLANADDPVIYYAGEIDNAQEKGEEIKPEWGRIQFLEKVESILHNIHEGDRALRIQSNIFKAIEECRQILETLDSDPAIIAVAKAAKADKQENSKILKRLAQSKMIASGDVQNEANKTAAEIVDILTGATDSFIYDKMDGIDFKALFKGKKKYGDELLKEYQDNYIRLDSGWVQDIGKEYVENIRTLMDGIYVDFELDMEGSGNNSTIDSGKLKIGNFAERVADGIQKDMLDKLIPILIEVITGVVLLFIPGLNFIDTAYAIVAGFGGAKGLTNSDKLHQKAKSIATNSRVQIRQQKPAIKNELREIGKQTAEQYYIKIKNELETRGLILDKQEEQYNNIIEEIEAFKEELNEQEKTVKELFGK